MKEGDKLPKITIAREKNLENVIWGTIGQGQVHTQMSRAGVIELARKAGALVTFGRRQRIHFPTLDAYLLNSARFDNGTESE